MDSDLNSQIVIVGRAWLLQHAVTILLGIIILAIGWYLAALLSRQAARLLPRTGYVDKTIVPLVSQIVRYGILLITLIIVLSQFGVQTASILAVLGAAGLAIALALQGTLSNLAAGLMLLWLRPFNVGEYVDADGIAGTVVEIGLFGTRLRTYDGVFVFAPNSRIWSAKILNFTREPTRMIELKVGISYGADLAQTRAAILSVAQDPRVLPDPAPLVFVETFGDGAVLLVLRAWVNGADWWQATIDLREQIKLRLDAEGIDMPHNKLDLLLKHTPAALAAASHEGHSREQSEPVDEPIKATPRRPRAARPS